MIGKPLAHYEITEKLGAGGMGEVYRASDSKLVRDVALKILPEAFAKDLERMARFQREAQVLAQLNHPNIAAIYGLEMDGGLTALALELVEGPTLADRMRPGAIPVDDALPIARQIAEAIESAHERGIVHRDLKPANVKFTGDGAVKVLDFGLAKAFEDDPGGSSSAAGLDSPTVSPAFTSPVITGALTGANVILGTAAYMSPEQARGKTVDKRADIWSFGVVVFEMLTGRRLFEGETISDTLAAVLKTDPDWSSLPNGTPEPVIRLLQRCLERDPRKRLRDIGEARVRLEQWSQDPTLLNVAPPVVEIGPRPSRPSRIPWVITGVVVLAAILLQWTSRTEPPPARKFRIGIHLPHQDQIRPADGVNVQISPKGDRLVYRASEELWTRRLDGQEAEKLEGTENVLQFAFSPDGDWIAFISNGRLRRVNVEGGAPIDVCDADLVSRGVAWVNASTIVFAPNFFGGLKVASLETGEVRDLTEVDEDSAERSHRWPVALPDGRSVLFLCQ